MGRGSGAGVVVGGSTVECSYGYVGCDVPTKSDMAGLKFVVGLHVVRLKVTLKPVEGGTLNLKTSKRSSISSVNQAAVTLWSSCTTRSGWPDSAHPICEVGYV